MVLEKKVSVSVSENLVSEKSLGFGFGQFGLEIKYQFRENFVSEISHGFRKFVIGKKVSVSVSVKILVSSFSGSQQEI